MTTDQPTVMTGPSASPVCEICGRLPGHRHRSDCARHVPGPPTTPTPPAMTDAEVAEPDAITCNDGPWPPGKLAATGSAHYCRLSAGHVIHLDGDVAWSGSTVPAERLAAENARLRERAAAAEDRYTRLVGEVERHAGAQCPCDTNGECLARLYEAATSGRIRDHGDLARSAKRALAAAAPQAAPAQPRLVCSADGGNSCPPRTPNCPPDCPQTTAPSWGAALAAPDSPTAADPEPVRVTGEFKSRARNLDSAADNSSQPELAPSEAQEGAEAIVREAIEDSANQDDEGSMWLLEADFPAAADRIVRWLGEAGWTLLPPAHPAGDEHPPSGEGAALIAATAQEAEAIWRDNVGTHALTLQQRVTDAWAETARILARTLDERPAGDEHLQALRDGLTEAGHTRLPDDPAALVSWLLGMDANHTQTISQLGRALAAQAKAEIELAEARREAERADKARRETAHLAVEAAGRFDAQRARVVEITKDLDSYCATAVGSDALKTRLLRALVDGSDTTAGEEGSDR